MSRLRSVLPAPLLAALLLFACTQAHDHPHGAPGEPEAEETPARPVTVWSPEHEIFAEHDLPLPSVPAAYAVHVTQLRDGAPQTSGDLLQRFAREGRIVEARSAAPARPGIHLGEFTLPAAGEWTWEILVGGETIPMPPVEVAADEAGRARIAAALEDVGGVTMLKEQQWPIRLRTALVAERALAERVEVLVRVEAPPGDETTLRAPVSGVVSGLSARPWPKPGERLEGGAVLGQVRVGAAGADAAALGSWKLELEAARREAEQGALAAEAAVAAATARREQAAVQERRLAELLRSESAAPREHEEAALALRLAETEAASAQAALAVWRRSGERLARLLDAGGAGDPWSVELFPARPGTVVEVFAAPGDWVEAGAPLLRLVDGGEVWLTALMPHAAGDVGADLSLRLTLPGGGTREFPGPGARLLLADAPADPATRARPVVFACAAEDGLRAGAVLRGTLAITAPRRAVAVPASAIVDEDGIPAVYLHAAGETFVKRLVRTGVRDGGYVEILEGLAVGERIVVDGAPVVRLVSLSGAIPEHAH